MIYQLNNVKVTNALYNRLNPRQIAIVYLTAVSKLYEKTPSFLVIVPTLICGKLHK